MRKVKCVPSFFLVLFILLVSFSMRANPLSNVPHGHDSSMFLYFGKGISEGLVPYSDMFDHKGPILFLIEYLAVVVGQGNYSLGIWIVEILFLIGVAFYLYKTAILYTSDRVISALSLLLCSGLFILCYEGGNLSEEFALFFISGSLYKFSKIFLLDKDSKLDYILIGIFGGITFFIRANMISLWGVFCLYFLIHDCYKKHFGLLFRRIIFIFTGGFSILLIVIVYCLLTNSLTDMINQAFLMNISYSNTDLYTKYSVASFFIEVLRHFSIPMIIVIFLINYLEQYKTFTTNYKALYLLMFAYALINFYTVVMSGRTYLHYMTTQLGVVVIIVSVSLFYLVKRISRKTMYYLGLMLISVMFLSPNASAIEQRNIQYNFVTTKEKNDLENISNYIKGNTDRNDSIYVHNLDANIYLMSNRYSNSRFFVLPAINYLNFPSLSEEFKESLARNKPKFIVTRNGVLSTTSNDNYLDKAVFNATQQDYIIVKYFENSPFTLYKLK